MTLNTIAYPVVGATKAEAEDKMAVIEHGYREVDGLSLLSEAMNFDFARKGMDETFSDEELASMSGMQAMRDHVLRVKRHPTPRDFLEVTRRGRPGQAIVGGPKEVADRLEQWFVERACDGYVVGGTHTPGTFEDFVRLVVPELQRRGCFRRSIPGRRCGRIGAAAADAGLVEVGKAGLSSDVATTRRFHHGDAEGGDWAGGVRRGAGPAGRRYRASHRADRDGRGRRG